MPEIQKQENASGAQAFVATFTREDIEKAVIEAAMKAAGDYAHGLFRVSIDGPNTFDLTATVVLQGE